MRFLAVSSLLFLLCHGTAADPATTYAKLEKLSQKKELEAYNNLSPKDQNDYWVGRFEAHKARGQHFEGRQVGALDHAIEWAKSRDEARVPEVEEKLFNAFGEHEVAKMATFHGYGLQGDDDDGNGGNGADLARRQEKWTKPCHCTSGWLGGCGIPFVNCQTHGIVCGRIPAKCGIASSKPCDGYCLLR